MVRTGFTPLSYFVLIFRELCLFSLISPLILLRHLAQLCAVQGSRHRRYSGLLDLTHGYPSASRQE